MITLCLNKFHTAMKRNLSYLFPLLLLLASSCSKQNNSSSNVNSVKIPTGNFKGQFTLIHENSKTGKLDTAYAIITLALTPAATYSVGGDTTTIQAPSNGTFTADGSTFDFTDATVTKKTPLNPPKKHLNGLFLYTYDGYANLQISGSSDTLSYLYSLKSY